MTDTQRFYPLLPGAVFPGDWYDGAVPANASFGADCVADSAFCFKRCFSRRPTALRFGDHVTVWRTSFSLEDDAEVEIGDYCYLANASIAVASRVTIGSYVMVSGGVTIADSDFHPMEPAARIRDTVALAPGGDRRTRPPIEARPVTIGDDVWIGPNASIMKGVTIGAGAVIEPGAVVIRDVPAGAVVAGNPAVVVGEVDA